ncbi:MAG: hypothetical protein ACM3SQ_20430 [Betaproteobacteria bacterium]
MGAATLDLPAGVEATLRDKAADVRRRATNLSEDVQRLKSLAEDAVDDGMYTARRAMKNVRRRVQGMEDLRDETIHRVKREPVKAVGIAFGAGLLLGAGVGLLLRRRPCE